MPRLAGHSASLDTAPLSLSAPVAWVYVALMLRNLRERFVTHLIGDYVPVLNLVRRPAPWPTLRELRAYPLGSLGHHVAAYLDARGLPFKVRYENHDAIHAILDYDTTIQGEMQVQAFLWANGASSPAGRVLFVVGGALLPEQWSSMRAAYARGRAADPIDEARLPTRLREPIEALRRTTGARTRVQVATASRPSRVAAAFAAG